MTSDGTLPQNGDGFVADQQPGVTPSPWDVLSRSYRVQLTEDFEKTFCQDPVALPPPPLRQAFWRVLVGRKLYEELLANAPIEAERNHARAMEQYRRDKQEYDRRLRDTQLANKEIENRNRDRASLADQRQAAYHDALAVHQRRFSDNNFNRLKSRLRKRLEWTLDSQHSAILAMHRQTSRSAIWHSLVSARMLCWLVLLSAYIWCGLYYPVLAIVPAFFLVDASKSLVRSAWSMEAEQVRNWYKNRGLREDDGSQKIIEPWEPLDVPTTFRRYFRGYCGPLLKMHPNSTTHPSDKQESLATQIVMVVAYLFLCFIPFVALYVAGVLGLRWLYPKWELVANLLPAISLNAVIQVGKWLSYSFACFFGLVSGVVLLGGYRIIGSNPRRARKLIDDRRKTILGGFDHRITDNRVIHYFRRRDKTPLPPLPPPAADDLQPLPPPPSPPTKVEIMPDEPQPPDYDDGSEGNYADILRGTKVYTDKETAFMARRELFESDQVRPHFLFGGVPIPLCENQSPHIVCIGTTGSGKTTTMRHLMSALLPLTQGQSERIVQRAANVCERHPTSSHEWSRSFTYQAVVYNSKDENIPFLAALGFDVGSDLIILDPADRRCFAWDVCRDINDRDAISQFADLMVPVVTKAEHKNKDGEFWDALARRIIKAIIISFRNAAFAQGKEPAWTMRDLVRAVGTRDALHQVLSHHDNPEEARGQLLNVESEQASSIYLTATRYVSQFEEVGERWAEAERRGRKFSFKEWADHGRGTVLVLPNTQRNVDVYDPLNRIFFKALANLVLDHRHTEAQDQQGRIRVKQRYFFIDELGSAGNLADLQRLMSDGRSFGVHVVLGVHQLSQLRETYGNNGAESILGLCPYAALLKTGDPTTAEWMSKRIGDTMKVYRNKTVAKAKMQGTSTQDTTGVTNTHQEGKNQSHTEGKSAATTETQGSGESKPTHGGPGASKSTNQSRGKTDTTQEQDTTGTNSSDSIARNSSRAEGTQESTTDTDSTAETNRQEAAIIYGEILNLPDPSLAGCVAGYFLAPSFFPWRADVPFDLLAPRLEFADAQLKTRKTELWHPDEDERVSKNKPWSPEDRKRLFLDESQQDKRNNTLDCDGEPPKLESDFGF